MAFNPCESEINGRIGHATITFPSVPPGLQQFIYYIDIADCFALDLTQSDRGGIPFIWNGNDTPSGNAYSLSQAINTWDDPSLIEARNNWSLFAHFEPAGNSVTVVFEIPNNNCCGGLITYGDQPRDSEQQMFEGQIVLLELSPVICCPTTDNQSGSGDIDCSQYPENKHVARIQFVDDGVIWGDPNIDSRRFIAPPDDCEQSPGCAEGLEIGNIRTTFELEYTGPNWAAENRPGALVTLFGDLPGVYAPGVPVPDYVVDTANATASLSDYMANVYIPGYAAYFGPSGADTIPGYQAFWQQDAGNPNRGVLIYEFDARLLSNSRTGFECTEASPCDCSFAGLPGAPCNPFVKPDFYRFDDRPAFPLTEQTVSALPVTVNLISHICCCDEPIGNIPIQDWDDLSTSSYNNLSEFVDGFVAFYNGNGPITGNGIDWAGIWGGAGTPVGVRKVAFDTIEVITDFALYNDAFNADLCADGLNLCFWTPWDLRGEDDQSYTNNLNVQFLAENCCFKQPFVPPDVVFDPPPERGREPLNVDCFQVEAFEECISGVAGLKRLLVLDRAFYQDVWLDGDGKISQLIIDPPAALWVELNPNYFETSLGGELQLDENGFRYNHSLSVAKEILTHEARNVIHKLIERDFVMILQDGNDRYWFLGENFPVRLAEHSSEIGGRNSATNRNDLSFIWSDYYMAREILREAVEGGAYGPGINTDPDSDDCGFYVGLPLGPYTLYALRDCFLYDMRNNDLN